MTKMSEHAGETVLIRARVSDDGRSVLIAPGIELPEQSCQIVCAEAPECRGSVGLMLYFHSAADMIDFVESFEGAYDAEGAHAMAMQT